MPLRSSFRALRRVTVLAAVAVAATRGRRLRRRRGADARARRARGRGRGRGCSATRARTSPSASSRSSSWSSRRSPTGSRQPAVSSTTRQERRWSREALTAQRLFISRMGVQGAPIRPVFAVHAGAERLRRRARPAGDRAARAGDRGRGRLPRARRLPGRRLVVVRRAAPTSPPEWACGPDVGLPGFDGRGVTIALLDTGVDRAQPYLRGRVQEGIDIVERRTGARSRRAGPTIAPSSRRTARSSPGSSSAAAAPAGSSGVAPGASVVPIRVAGWQRDADGRVGGLLAHRPDRRGARARGRPERRRRRARRRPGRADRRRRALRGLRRGPARTGGRGGAQARHARGRARRERRPGRSRLRQRLRSGRRAGGADGRRGRRPPRSLRGPRRRPDRARHRARRRAALGGLVAPDEALTADVAAPERAAPAASRRRVALPTSSTRTASAVSPAAPRSCPRGATRPAAVRAAARAGASSVVVYGGALPAGGLGLDERAPVPVVSIPVALARRLLRALAEGESRGDLDRARARSSSSGAGQRMAAFSSRGLAFDGRVKPELAAPGVALATSEPGANADGSRALRHRQRLERGRRDRRGRVRAARPGAPRARARARSRASSSAPAAHSCGRPSTAQGAGLVDVGRAAAGELATQPATLASGSPSGRTGSRERVVLVRSLSPRTLRVRVARAPARLPGRRHAGDRARRSRLIIRPGAHRPRPPDARRSRGRPQAGPPPRARSSSPRRRRAVRVPFAIAFASAEGTPLLADVGLSDVVLRARPTRGPQSSRCAPGRVRSIGGAQQIEPVGRLDIELWTGSGRARGRDRPAAEPAPVADHVRDHRPRPGRPGACERGLYRLRILAFPDRLRAAPRARSVTFRIE